LGRQVVVAGEGDQGEKHEFEKKMEELRETNPSMTEAVETKTGQDGATYLQDAEEAVCRDCWRWSKWKRRAECQTIPISV